MNDTCRGRLERDFVLDDEKMIYIMDVDASRALFMMSIALQVHVGISCIGLVSLFAGVPNPTCNSYPLIL
jgi:hypothetical protein